MIAVLQKRLKEHLTAALSTLKLAAQSDCGDALAAPQVFIGDPPPKRQGASRDVPCVVILPLGGHMDRENGATEAVADMALICVVYNPESGDMEGGEADLASLQSAVIGALIPCSEGEPLARRFVLTPDEKGRLLPWVKAHEQPKPFLQVTIASRWCFKGWE